MMSLEKPGYRPGDELMSDKSAGKMGVVATEIPDYGKKTHIYRFSMPEYSQLFY